MSNGGLRTTFLIVALGAVLIAACGGGSKPPGLTAEPSSPALDTPTPTALPPTGTPVPLRDPTTLAREGNFEAAAAGFGRVADLASGPEAKAAARLQQALALHDGGASAGALTAASEAVTLAPAGSMVAVQARLMTSRLLLTAPQRPSEALAVLEPLSGGATGGMEPYVLAETTRAALAAGDAALAESTWARLLSLPNLPSSIADGAYAAQAEAARSSGDLTRYVDSLRRGIAARDAASTRYQLAEALRESGDEPGRLAHLRAITTNFPAHPLAVRAVRELTDAGAAIDPAQEGFIYYRAGALTDAHAALETAVAQPARTGTALAFATFYLAAVLEDRGRAAEAIATYDRVPPLAPASSYAHRAHYWAARVMESTKDYASASERYVVLANLAPGEFTAEAVFRAGYVLYTANQPAAATAAWSRILGPDARTLYWQGRAFEELGDTVAARQSFERAAATGPLDFHGVEARRRLGEVPQVDATYRPRTLAQPPEWSAIEVWLTARAGPASPPIATTAVDLAMLLAGAGLRAEAAEVITDALTRPADPWMVLSALKAATDAGLTSTSARLADRLVTSARAGWADVPVSLVALGHPAGFAAVLDAEARAANIDPLFLAALIRVESFWEADAVSPAGALGLTQVMPATGQGIAAQLGVADFAPDSLLTPARSLRFGAYYIGQQLRAYALPHAALAAYNAGPSRAATWLARWEGGTAAEFVEIIDIDETRSYVELVLQGYARYERAYGDGR